MQAIDRMAVATNEWGLSVEKALRKRQAWTAAILAVAALATGLPAEQARAAGRVAGTVVDGAGSPVPGITVWLQTATSRSSRVTDAVGRFAFDSVEPPGDLTVQAAGFRRLERKVLAEDRDRRIDLVLEPAGVSEELNVTATRTPVRLADTAASVVVLSAADLSASAAPALDEALRQVPAFSLFRRSGSRTANPTSQGVSLRGVGASGASRAAVMDDGVPLNDPFGGWIYWARVPRAAVERIEILRGGASDLYGSGALGGAIQLFRRSAASPFGLVLEASYGSLETPEASLFAGARREDWAGSISAEAFRTDGYVAADPAARGAVDVRSSSSHRTFDLTVERFFGSGRAFLRGSSFDESRENGTPLQENDTENVQAALGGEWSFLAGSLSARAFATDQDYHQSFSAISADRQIERLTRLQEVPARAAGLALQWAAAVRARHLLVVGLEGRRVEGESREEVVTPAGSTFVAGGGRERTASLFLEDVFSASERMTITAGLRLDAWWNTEGELRTRAGSGAPPAVTRLTDRSETAWSPRLAILYRLTGALSLTGSAYRSFRAPSLNELYRSFRVGDVLTLANEDLQPESLGGWEAGVAVSSRSGKLAGRANLFWMTIEDAVGNVTLSATPSLITRQRRNIGETRSRGLELDFEVRPDPRWKLSGGYQLSDSTVESFRQSPELEGLRVPQVPRHKLALQLLYADPSLADVALSARWTSSQFEDDQNRLTLSSFWTLDAVLSRALRRGFEAFVAVENLLDERYEIGRTPVRTLGAPRLFRGGFRLRLPS